MSQPKFRLAICGGGIGGLTLAAVVQKYSLDIQIDIYESQSEFNTVGAGIGVWKGTWAILKALGLDIALANIAGFEPPRDGSGSGMWLRKADQREEGFEFHEIKVGAVMLHRAQLLKALTDSLLPSVKAHFSKRLTGYTEEHSGVIKLQFRDGTEAEADVLVGADGFKSPTRGTLFRRAAERAHGAHIERLQGFVDPTWTGTHAYRALVNTEHLLSIYPSHKGTTKPIFYCGTKKYAVSYPISRGTILNLVFHVTVPGGEGTRLTGPSVRDVPQKELLGHFEGWEPDVRALIESTNHISRWDICTVRGLPFYSKGRIALLGDAAHAMAPSQGAGAGQAIEDAFILGRILSHPKVNLENVAKALNVYDVIRRPRASEVLERSRENKFVYELDLPGLDAGRDLRSASSLKIIDDELEKQLSWNWYHDPHQDWVQAEKELGSEETV